MARPGRPEQNRAARSFRQLRRFHHGINSDKVFGTHKRDVWVPAPCDEGAAKTLARILIENSGTRRSERSGTRCVMFGRILGSTTRTLRSERGVKSEERVRAKGFRLC